MLDVDETDVDCGGICAAAFGKTCDDGMTCAVTLDCNDVCFSGAAASLQAHQGTFALATTAAATANEHVGCYVDAETRAIVCMNDDGSAAVVQSDVGGSVASVETCAANCAGFQYFDLQWSRECFCANVYDKHGTEAETDRNTACSANGDIMIVRRLAQHRLQD